MCKVFIKNNDFLNYYLSLHQNQDLGNCHKQWRGVRQTTRRETWEYQDVLVAKLKNLTIIHVLFDKLFDYFYKPN